MTDDDRLTALEMRVADLALLSDTVALIHRSLAALYEEAEEHRWDLPMGWSSDLPGTMADTGGRCLRG